MPQKAMEKEQFLTFLKAVKAPKETDADFLYSIFSDMIEGVGTLAASYPALLRANVSQIQLALYLINEHLFYLASHPTKKQEELTNDEGYINMLISISFAKYFSTEQIPFGTGSFASRFSPTLSTINLFLNYILTVLANFKSKNNTQILMVSIMNKGFQLAKAISILLENGYETEAFSAWRSLHENESILTVIVKYGEPVTDAYIRHARYGVAFRGGIPSKEETDKVFEEIKAGMREKGLKSKDMKRYIEYGWLYSIENVEQIEGFKINFRDGVERMANLSQYAKSYELSSEIAHSSPLLIFSRKEEYFARTLLNLYESFFRLERIFSAIVIPVLAPNAAKGYNHIKKLYFGELQSVYGLTIAHYAKPSKPKKEE